MYRNLANVGLKRLGGGVNTNFASVLRKDSIASLFTSLTDTMRSFFAQHDHLGVFHYMIDFLDFMNI